MLEAGTFVSEDGKHTLTITAVNFQEGTFTGTFTDSDTPLGAFTYPASAFTGSWLYTADRATINYGIACSSRNDSQGYTFVMRDYWVGTSGDTPSQITLSGSRSYTTKVGGQQLSSFENLTFTRQ